MKNILLGGYLVLLHIAVVVLLMKTGAVTRAAIALGLTRPPADASIAWFHAAHARVDSAVPDGATVFLGDSLTYSLVTAGLAPLPVNFAVLGQRSDHLLSSMDSHPSLRKARAVVLMIGTNDILEGKAAGLEERYAQILAKVPAGVPVVFSSAPPISRPGAADQARAAAMALRRVCAQDKRCQFVDLHSALERVPGALTSDGVHMEAAGYAVWAKLLRDTLGQTALAGFRSGSDTSA